MTFSLRAFHGVGLRTVGTGPRVLNGCPPTRTRGRRKEHVNQTPQTRRNEEGRKNLNEKKSHLSLYIRIPFSFLPPVCVHGRSFLLSPFLLFFWGRQISDRDMCPVCRPTPWNNPNNQQSNRSKSFTQKEHQHMTSKHSEQPEPFRFKLLKPFTHSRTGSQRRYRSSSMACCPAARSRSWQASQSKASPASPVTSPSVSVKEFHSSAEYGEG